MEIGRKGVSEMYIVHEDERVHGVGERVMGVNGRGAEWVVG